MRDQIANIRWIMEKVREFQKNIYSCFFDYAKAFVWIATNYGEFLKRWEYQTIWPASWEICMQIRNIGVGSLSPILQLELDMEQQTGSKQEKEYIKTAYCHPAYLIYMQSTSFEMPDWWSISWSQDCQEKYH